MTIEMQQCVDEDTWVTTNNGLHRIKHIRRGMSVLTNQGYRQVTDTFIAKEKTAIMFTTKKGYTIRVSPTHRLMMKDGQYKQAFAVTPDDKLVIQPHGPRLFKKNKEILKHI